MQLIVAELPEEVKSVVFKIEKVTKHDGYCSNKSDKSIEAANNNEDYSFEKDKNERTSKAVPVKDGVAVIPFFCKDYGGTCVVSATPVPKPKDLEIPSVRIPRDDNQDEIADAWQELQAKLWKEQYGEDKDRFFFTLEAGKADAEKVDPDKEGEGLLPHNARNSFGVGDGLDVLVEYRGVILDGGGADKDGNNGHGGGHLRLSAARKEIHLEVDVAAGMPEDSLKTAEDKAFAISDVLNGSGRLLIRDAGIVQYWIIDEEQVAAPAGPFPNLVALARFLGDHRKPKKDSLEKKLLRKTTTHVMLFGSGNVAGKAPFFSFDEGSLLRDAERQVEQHELGTVGFLIDSKRFATTRTTAIPVDEMAMNTLTHEVVHHVIDPPSAEPWEPGPGGKSQSEHHEDPAEGAVELMLNDTTAKNRKFETAKILKATLDEIQVAKNASLCKEK